ncbi:hypothetical protein EHF36_07915 [Kerstersia gyiorum]|uniref:hypothetical protein n=1 Tax=Kerstersia gyiorum TaxID=206506 RepID=UPI001070D093|nr:hypothetical protein [Kerstersia gyiorum]QBR40560.1 hypothetical protein EHF36_07915 [Kerstersia gyiorum]
MSKPTLKFLPSNAFASLSGLRIQTLDNKEMSFDEAVAGPAPTQPQNAHQSKPGTLFRNADGSGVEYDERIDCLIARAANGAVAMTFIDKADLNNLAAKLQAHAGSNADQVMQYQPKDGAPLTYNASGNHLAFKAATGREICLSIDKAGMRQVCAKLGRIAGA